MKPVHFLIILILLQYCEFKGQEKVTRLSKEDQRIITKAIDNQSFELESIKKTDFAQNTVTICHFGQDFLLNEKEITYYDKNKKIDIVREYSFDPDNKKFLSLFSEKKYLYAKGYEKMLLKVWRDGKESGSDEVEKTFDERGKILQNITSSYDENNKRDYSVKQIFKYTIDELKGTEMICVEEYSETRTPKSFENCVSYLYENGQTTKKIVGNEYVYDNKNRLIKEVTCNKSGKPYFEDLYIYDDKKNTMEHQRYRFNNSKFLVGKDQKFYDADGLTQKIIYFNMSEDDTLQPEKAHLIFYDKNNKEKLSVDLKSKTFVAKDVPPPM